MNVMKQNGVLNMKTDMKMCPHDFCPVTQDLRCCKYCNDREICDEVCIDQDGYYNRKPEESKPIEDITDSKEYEIFSGWKSRY